MNRALPDFGSSLSPHGKGWKASRTDHSGIVPFPLSPLPIRHPQAPSQRGAVSRCPLIQNSGYRKAQPSVSRSCPLESVPTGAPWRDLPACFGNWNSQLGRFASGAGPPVVCCSGCSRPSGAIPIWNTCPSTAPLSRFTSKPLGQKGQSAPVYGPLLRRADNEDGGAGGRSGQSGALPPATRTESREQRGSATARQHALWRSAG